MAQAAHDEQSLRLGLSVLGDLNLARGAYPEAGRLLGQALEVARALAEPYAISVALLSLAELAAEKGEVEHATDLQREALALARRAGSADCAAGATFALGELALKAGHADAARHWFQQTMDVLSKAGGNLAAPVQGPGGPDSAAFDLGAYHASMVGNPARSSSSVTGHDFAARWDPSLNDGAGGYHISGYRETQTLAVGEGAWVFSFVQSQIHIG